MTHWLTFAARVVLILVVVAMAGWSSLALWFSLPVAETLRAVLASGTALLALGGLFHGLVRGRVSFSLAPASLAVAATIVWWSTLQPSNDREWVHDVARLPTAEIKGDLITLRNVRRFKYQSESEYTPDWYEKTVDLRQLDSLDLIAVYWMGDAIAHTFLSFGFAGDYISISIETRKERGEIYSTIAGFFRQYELYYVVGDESDLIGLRTTYRVPPEDVYLYRTTVRPENIRRLFLQYVEKINALNERAEFYNTLTTNCTTNVVTHILAVRKDYPTSWKMLLSGYFPELVYERGGLHQSLPFEELRARSLINGKARNADGATDFSERIRSGLPGL